jgi:hypothetical protein
LKLSLEKTVPETLNQLETLKLCEVDKNENFSQFAHINPHPPIHGFINKLNPKSRKSKP